MTDERNRLEHTQDELCGRVQDLEARLEVLDGVVDMLRGQSRDNKQGLRVLASHALSDLVSETDTARTTFEALCRALGPELLGQWLAEVDRG